MTLRASPLQGVLLPALIFTFTANQGTFDDCPLDQGSSTLISLTLFAAAKLAGPVNRKAK